MVVTRRTPVAPLPPPARNFASQGPRTSLPKDTAAFPRDTSPLAGPSSGNRDHPSGLDDTIGKKPNKSRKRGKNKRQKSNFQVFLNFLTKLLLLAFTIYTFAVCPQDTHLQSPLCRGLTEYRRIVLDPYIAPIQTVLTHSSVAPHIERAKPYVHRAVEFTTPILFRTRQEWNLRVVPQWEKRVVPEWNRRVLPQWNKYVAPRIQFIQSKSEPYRLRVTQAYGQYISPRVQLAIYNLQRWQRQAEPYVLLAISKTKHGYSAAKPYAVPLAKTCGHLLQQFATFVREQRQKFVDPHVAKMWEKVKELSRGRQVIHDATPEHETLSPDTPFTILETLGHETVVSSAYPSTAAYDASATSEATDVARTPSSLGFVDAAPHTQPTVSEPGISTHFAGSSPGIGIETFLSAESVLAESLHESEPPTSGAPVFVEEIDEAISSVLLSSAPPATEEPTVPPPPVTPPKATVAATASPFVEDPDVAKPPFSVVATGSESSSSTPFPYPSSSVTPSKIPVSAASATVPPTNPRADDEIDFDAFYAELGLGEPLGNIGGFEESSGPPSPPTETEEERAELLRRKEEETARKRADIEIRQSKWEAELRTQMERSTSQLQSRLGSLRTAAAADLVASPDVRSSIEELVGEAEKYLKGAEIYLKNLKGETRRSDEKLALWDRVADRVSDKFNERLTATEGVVSTWYRIVLDKELSEVATVAAQVRELAEKGQLDLGLDYAWLEDVTYDDWQRYHALIGTSEQYAHEVAAIRNGTHPHVVITNPIGPILEDLESEVQDVVIGFETRLRRIKRDGERAFNNHGNGVAPKEEEKGSGVEPEVGAETRVSILPVQDRQDVLPPVILGRSREEVLEALGKVEPVSGAGRPETGVGPEEAVSQLAREVEGGGAGIAHTEL